MLSKKERKSSSRYDLSSVMVKIEIGSDHDRSGEVDEEIEGEDDEDYHSSRYDSSVQGDDKGQGIEKRSSNYLEYPLSRFILSRILMTVGIKSRVANTIAFQLKKNLIDERKKQISQEDLMERVFQLIGSSGKAFNKSGKAEKFMKRVRMMQNFYQKRIPLLILFFGTGGVGKTTISNKLSEIINISAVLHTEVVYQLTGTYLSSGFENENPVWCRVYSPDSKSVFLEDYKRQCVVIRKAINGDIKKCFGAGKSIIIQGIDMDPSLFSEVIQKYGLREGINNEGRGVIIPFYLKNEEYVDVYLDRFRRNKLLDDISLDQLRKSFDWIKEYLEGLKLDYKLEIVNVDLLNMKKTLKKLQKMFIHTIEKHKHLY